MNRNDFKRLSLKRLIDAETLLRNRNYDGAYYLCGYIVEFGLKACIAKKTKRHDFPPDRNTIDKIYQHRPGKLIKAADLQQALENEMKHDPYFEVNWNVVKDWSENSRYEEHSARKAQDLYSAVVDTRHGVLRWIRRYW